MIGYYDYTVILTYVSLISSVLGMFCAAAGHMRLAVVCLAFSGLLDAFDGKVARTKKNRTDGEKQFGIQLDSLCDMVCFGALPAVICYHLGMHSVVGMVILCLYVLAGLIRLAWFNVKEEERQKETDANRKYYQGMPITSIAVILPLFYAMGSLFPGQFGLALHFVMAATGALFVINFPFRKPNNKELAVMIAVVGLAVLYILACHRWGAKLPWHWQLRRVTR